MAMEDATLVKHTKQAFILRANADGEEFSLQGEMLVGREVECAIPLNSGHISRYHAKINVSPNGVYVEDLHSTNGTYVNGSKIKGRVRLTVGDEVAFDDLQFRLVSSHSGNASSTILTPRRHTPSAQPQVPSPPSASVSSIYPNIDVKEEFKALENKVDSLRDSPLDELDDINIIRRRQQKPSPVEPSPQVEKMEEARNPASEDQDAEGDRTQLLSSLQLGDLIERRKDEELVSLGSGPRFIVMTAPIRGKMFTVGSGHSTQNWKIGRDPESEIFLNDKTISNDHARLALTPAGGYLLTATHAKNGIYVNGILTTKTQLKHDDKIQIGRTELVFKTDQKKQNESALSNTTPDPFLESGKARRFGILATIATVVVLIAAMVFTGR